MLLCQFWHQVHQSLLSVPRLAHPPSLRPQTRYMGNQPCKPAVAGLAELEELNPVTWRPTARSISPVQARRVLPSLPCCPPVQPY